MMAKKKEIWKRITKRLSSELSKSDLDTWISQTALTRLDPELAVIEVPNKFFVSWLYDNFFSHIRDSFEKELNLTPQIRFVCSPKKSIETPDPWKQRQTADPRPHLNPSFTFDNFITGKSNRFAFAAALEVASNPSNQYNPLYIFAPLSLGKTHLLNAIGNQILVRDPMATLRYVTSSQFSADFFYALKDGRLQGFSKKYRDLDVLLVDDIDLISGRTRVQEQLTSLLNILLESNKQIVMTGKRPPKLIPNLTETLRSRLEWGLLSEIEVPEQETKIKIIKQKAGEQRMRLPDDVTFYLANTSNDIRTLIQNVIRVLTHLSLHQNKIDISTAKFAIINRQSPKISTREIQKLTAEYFNISLSDLLSNKKKRKVSYPRQLAMFLCRNITGLSFKEIGQAFGKKDHSTVIYAVKRIEKDKAEKIEVMDDLTKLQNLIE